MSEYTAGQVEEIADWCMANSSGVYRNSAIAAHMLLAYAATLRQQPTNPPEIGSKLVGDGAVSDEVRLFSGDLDVLANLGFPKTAERIRAVLYRDVAPLLRAPAEQGGRVDEGLFQRACEVVHHETDCPAIGGNGDADCRCDAVPFLRDLNTVLTKPTNEDAVDRAVDTFHDVYDGVSHNLPEDAGRHVLATAALAQNAQGELPLVEVTIVSFNGGSRLDFSSRDWWHKLPTGTHKLYTHAERARVPAGYDRAWLTSLAQSLASGAHLLGTDWQQRGYKNAANLEAASAFIRAVLADAPSQPEDAA